MTSWGIEKFVITSIDLTSKQIRKERVRQGIQFLVSHFEWKQKLFPRKMSTSRSQGKQFVVYNVEQILEECEKSNFIDCRLNAYPFLVDCLPTAPTIIFIDIDGDSTNIPDKLEQTLKINKSKLNNYLPTIMWTGNGYHVYIIIDTIALEFMPKLSELSSQPSRLFLKFAESWLTDNKSDSKHNPSFKSCLLRIPGTSNSKCLPHETDTEVKIIQKFQGTVHLDGSTLLYEFRLHLADEDIKVKIQSSKQFEYKYYKSKNYSFQRYEWIDLLLQRPIPDCRKCTIDLILAPYLIVIKNCTETEAFVKIKYWIQQCNQMKELSPSCQYFDNKIWQAIRSSFLKKIPPIAIRTLEQKYPFWFTILKNV